MQHQNGSKAFSIVDLILWILAIGLIVAALAVACAGCSTGRLQPMEVCLPSDDGQFYACTDRTGLPAWRPIEDVSQTHACLPLEDLANLVKECRSKTP